MSTLVNEFTKKITIQTATTVQDDIGNETLAFADLLHCSAKVNGTGGREYYAAAQVNAENNFTFETRYCSLLKNLLPQTTRITYNGNEYDVKHIDDFMQRHETVKFIAQRRF